VSSTRSLLLRGRGGSEEDLVHLEAGLEANRTCTENRKYRGRVWCGDRKRIGHRYFLPVTSMLTEIV
jgi:hypothetical protein